MLRSFAKAEAPRNGPSKPPQTYLLILRKIQSSTAMQFSIDTGIRIYGRPPGLGNALWDPELYKKTAAPIDGTNLTI